jgi:hypothetical protein
MEVYSAVDHYSGREKSCESTRNSKCGYERNECENRESVLENTLGAFATAGQFSKA